MKRGWDLRAIWARGRRERKLSCSRSTFHKYCQLLNIKKPKIRRRDDFYEPVTTKAPNEKWHADVTIFKTPEGKKHYLYLIVDNFSRKILSYKLDTSANAKTMVENLKQAITNIQSDFTGKIELIVDGGSENNNHSVDEYLKKLNISIRKFVALKDIEHSNSLVESTNKTLKSNFIQRKLKLIQGNPDKYIAQIIEEFNNKEHGAHVFYSPNEVYPNPEILSVENMKKANENFRGEFSHTYCNKCIA